MTARPEGWSGPVRDEGIGSWASRRALSSPHRIGLIHDGEEVTYRQILDRSVAVAHRLADLGLRRGDRVAYAGRNHPSFVYTMFATHMLGAIFVPLNFRLAAGEFDFVLHDSGAAALVFAPESARAVEGSPTATRLLERGAAVPIAGDGDGSTTFEDWLVSDRGGILDREVSRSDPAFILYTSGTTGRPKGVVLSHENIFWNCLNLFATVDVASDEIALVTSPMFHVAGLTQTLLPILLKGATAVLMPAWDADHCFDLIAAHQVTWLFGVPTMYASMDQSPRWSTTDVSSLRLLTAGGAPVPAPLIEAFQRRGLLFCQGYGLTESAPGATFLESESSWDKVGSAGLPLPFTRVRCVDENLVQVPVGARGELQISGPNVMSGYWNDSAATDAAFTSDGWLRSGDIATLDEDGFIYVVDRSKDMYISGGENVYPAEVESVLYAHPDIQDAAVIGVPDEKWGEVGRAFVVPVPGRTVDSAGLTAFMIERLAKYKVPRWFSVVDDLPRTGSGKVQKQALRDAEL